MATQCQRPTNISRVRPIGLGRATVAPGKRALYLVVVSLVAISTCFLIAELGFRLFWNPKYWIHTSRWDVGSGQTRAGKKWWPATTFRVESSEFQVQFRTDKLGYRARPEPVQDSHPVRLAFVGDSFTEGMQVAYDTTFCARLERLLKGNDASRPIVCENSGVSATDLFDYWHRIVHDVFAGDPPHALILCIYPGNDFQGLFPDEAFDADGHPTREFFNAPSWSQHVIAWINLHSKFGSYVQRALLSAGGKAAPPKSQGPKNWWADPEVASRASAAPAVSRSRALLRAIDEECRRHGTRLCVLVVGPVDNYTAKNGESPIKSILGNWGLDIPVIDVAIKARARTDYRSLTFPIDGHLNESGHAYIAREAAPALEAVLASSGKTASR
jgi:hypothetical protein